MLNTPKLTVEMLEKKGSKYSDRPPVPMTGELVGRSNLSVLLPYGDHFRESRRLFQRIMGTRAAVGSYHATEEAETHRFLQRVCASPDWLTAHIQMYVMATDHLCGHINLIPGWLVPFYCEFHTNMKLETSKIH
jgi:hypothetical protein